MRAVPVSVEAEHVVRAARRRSARGNSVEADTWAREQRVRRIGLALLGLQLIGLLIWSAFEYGRVVQQTDFAGDYQAWFLIAHGHLDPHVSVWGYTSFVRVHGELILWLLAPLWWIAPTGLTLLWVQDLAVVVAEVTIFWWTVDFAFGRWGGPSDTGAPARLHRVGRSRNRTFPPELLCTIGLVLFLANPWMYWAVSFDFHTEAISTAFIALAAYDLARHNRRFWIWVALTLLCGDVATTYIAGLGVSALLAGPAWRRRGLVLIGFGVGLTALLTALGANANSTGLQAFESPASKHAQGPGSLANLFTSPFTDPHHFFRGLWPDRLNIWANLAPAGAIGFVSAWGFGIPAVVLIENNLTGPLFSLFAFQNEAVYIFVTLGTVLVLQRLLQWRPAVAAVVAVLVIANTIGWFVVWFPKTSTSWVRVSADAAATIQRGLKGIPDSAEVVAAHGVVGGLSGRNAVAILEPRVAIHSRQVYFVAAPAQGIETDPVDYAIAQMARVADLPARVVASGGGAWVFEWNAPKGVKTISLPVACCQEPAWALSSAVGSNVTVGPPRDWRVTGNGGSGYLVDGDYWPQAPGHYVAKVDLASNDTVVNVEVWNSTDNALLARRTIISTNGRAEVDLPFSFHRVAPLPTRYGGAGPFRVVPLPNASTENQLEVRVWTSGGGESDVYWVSLSPAG
jgi:hypothetical protein